MADREKVIRSIEECTGGDCRGCHYFCKVINGDYCWDKLMKDAAELLKEQEAVKPYVTGLSKTLESCSSWWYACGNCNKPIDMSDKYCRHCGRSVKLE